MSGLDRSLDVLCLGFANHDLLVAIEGYPPPDTKMEALDLEEQGGGPAATAAVAIARLGGRVAMLSTVGDDPRGERILSDLAGEGVDVSHCTRSPGTSSLSLIVVDRKAGTRNVFRYRGTAPFVLERVDPELVKSARVLLVDSGMPRPALEAAAIARQAGVLVVVDPGEPKPMVEELMAAGDYPIPPVNTALAVTGESDSERAAEALLRRGGRAVVVTLGSAGYVIATAEGVRRESAFPVVEVVDTTGAGDAFHGGFAFALARGRTPSESARFGAAVAALKCRMPGGRTGLPTLPEVEAFLGRT